jgi:hypothetical protein
MKGLENACEFDLDIEVIFWVLTPQAHKAPWKHG